MLARIVIALTLAAALGAQANLLQNGDLESGPTIPTGHTQLTCFGSEIPGWRVVLGNVDFNAAFWSPSSGQHSVDLHGVERGAIEQTFPTHPGVLYEVLFDLGATETQRCYLSAAGLTSPTFSHTGPTWPRVTYARDQRWSFVATGTATTLRFDSPAASGAAGAHIDHVRVYARATAAFIPFGSGCAGSQGVPTLQAQSGSRPLIGQTFVAEVVKLSPSLADPIFIVFGLERAMPSVDLAKLGMPGCALHVSPLDARSLVKVGGVALWTVSIPQDTALDGAVLVAQGFAFDQAQSPNAFGATVTNGGELLLGQQ